MCRSFTDGYAHDGGGIPGGPSIADGQRRMGDTERIAEDRVSGSGVNTSPVRIQRDYLADAHNRCDPLGAPAEFIEHLAGMACTRDALASPRCNTAER